jgi:hypothetical protein
LRLVLSAFETWINYLYGMIKYRRLTLEELESLREEFLKFLIVQQIYPEEWEQIKINEKERAEEYLDLFSNLVFEKILTEIQFVEKITEKRLETYHFQANEARVLVLQAIKGAGIDFLTQPLKDIDPSYYELISGAKKYDENRNTQLFRLMESGAVKSDGVLYKKIALLLAESKS